MAHASGPHSAGQRAAPRRPPLPAAGQGKLREAEALFSEVLTGRLRVLGRAHDETERTYRALVRVLTAQGKARDAREVRAQYGGRA